MHAHHDHDHHHHAPLQKIGRAFVMGIVLNSLFVCIEAIAGFYYQSMALITDAGHNLSDVISLVLAMVAFRLSKVKTNERYTYGYKKTTIIAALLNALILLIAIGSIGWEATLRLFRPVKMPGNAIAAIAGIGILINAITALFFYKDREKDLNVKGAYLHLLADAAVSAGVVIAGIVMIYTQWWWIDSAISYFVIIVIFISTWKLLKDSIRLSLDGVPKNVDLQKLKQAVLQAPGVKDIHHIHVWAMSTTENALTAHLVIEKNTSDEALRKLKHTLRHQMEHLNIHHVTFETETEALGCEEENCD